MLFPISPSRGFFHIQGAALLQLDKLANLIVYGTDD